MNKYKRLGILQITLLSLLFVVAFVGSLREGMLVLFYFLPIWMLFASYFYMYFFVAINGFFGNKEVVYINYFKIVYLFKLNTNKRRIRFIYHVFVFSFVLSIMIAVFEMVRVE